MKIEKIEKVTRKTHNYNEDRFVIGKNIFAVLDGASSLYNEKTYQSDASLFVNYVKTELLKYKSGNLIDYINNISLNFLEKYTINYSDPAKIPSCGMAICHLINDKIECYLIGDCEISYIDKNNMKHLLQLSELKSLDSKAIKSLIDIAKDKNIDLIEARKYVSDLLISNRRLMNKENGYPVFTVTEKPDFKFHKVVLNASDIKTIFLATDGFAQAYDTLNIFDDYKDLYDINTNIFEVKDKIVETWNDDKKCNKYPRFKKQDDLTAIKITFE